MSSRTDRQMMARALQLARQGLYSTSPNPRVGCVICRDDTIIAEGWHQWAGEGHAEVNALAQLPAASKGATVYVTLEPCSHQGRTGPCAEALVAAGVSRVVVAMEDPNPQVAGRGLKILKTANIAVELGLLEEEARALNPGFIRRMQGDLPWLRAKSAMSLDGRTAMASGESLWITGPEARADVQRLRARSCAILTGVATVLADDPALTLRPETFAGAEAGQRWRQPLRVVLDSQLRTPPTARLFAGGGTVLIATVSKEVAKRDALRRAGAEMLEVAADANGRVALPALLQQLAQRGCNELMLEAGAGLCGALLQQGLVDEWFVYMAPTLMGSAGRPLAQWPMDSMVQRQDLDIIDIRAVGRDWRIHCRPRLHAPEQA